MSYEEKRVKVSNYGTLPANSPLLTDIPGTGGASRKLHKLAAAAFTAMAAAIRRDLGIDALAASGWRHHRWRSKQHYEETLVAKYGSVKAGRKWLAYNSPHETGLAVDFGVGGLEPKSRTAAKQRQTPLHAWLVAHAHEYGWHPYKTEPWHWEYPLSLAAFKTGVPSEGDDEPVSFAAGDEEDDTVEELDEESAAWFATEGAGERAREGAPRRGPRSGEFAGELDGGEDQPRIRWQIRWRIE